MATIIAFEGNDCVGKTTQTELLKLRIEKEGRAVKSIKFPDPKGYVGSLIYDVLADKPSLANGLPSMGNTDPKILAALYSFDRLLHKQELLDDAVSFIILDRYVPSNFVLQGSRISNVHERQKFIRENVKLEMKEMELPEADIVVYLRCSLERRKELLAQRTDKPDILEQQVELSELREEIYLHTLDDISDYVVIIDVDKNGVLRTPSDIHAEIWRRIY